MVKVLITPRSFGKYGKESFEIFEKEKIEVVMNPTIGILTEEEILELIEEVDGIIVGVDPLNKNVISYAKKLVAISKYGVGLDNIDLELCKERDIKVTITPNANSDAVADYAFTLLLSVARRLTEIHNSCHNGDFSKKISIDIYGKKLGVLGLGHIGKGVIERSKGFNMKLYGYDIYKDESFINENNIFFTSIENIFSECDFISIHLPLTNETKYLIDEKMLSFAKENLVIVNTARGGIIDENALYEALNMKKIYGAGLDVFEQEPPTDSKLLELENVIVGAHSGASTVGAVDKMSTMATLNLIQSLREKGVI